jgi:hypothetical protein
MRYESILIAALRDLWLSHPGTTERAKQPEEGFRLDLADRNVGMACPQKDGKIHKIFLHPTTPEQAQKYAESKPEYTRFRGRFAIDKKGAVHAKLVNVTAEDIADPAFIPFLIGVTADGEAGSVARRSAVKAEKSAKAQADKTPDELLAEAEKLQAQAAELNALALKRIDEAPAVTVSAPVEA